MCSAIFIAIIGDLSSGATRGVAEKVTAQVEALRNLGYDVHGYFGTSGENQSIDFPACVSLVPFDATKSLVVRKLTFLQQVLREIGNSKPDILYFRYPLSDPALLWFLKRIRAISPSTKIALERQTKELPELLARRSVSNLTKYLLELTFRVPVQRQVDCNICVTNEIGRYINAYFPKAVCITSGNGISRSLITRPKRLPLRSRDSISIVFVGNLTPWCGVDRVIRILAKQKFCYSGRKVIFTVIGEGVFEKQLKDEARPHQQSVRFLGHLSGKALADSILTNTIAIGAFNNGIRKLSEGSNLKLRLYCALGIPFAFAELDTDFPLELEASKYYRCINNSDDNELGKELLDFALEMNSEPEAHIHLTEYANTFLIWEKKFEALNKQVLES